jgi:hypothetical protein
MTHPGATVSAENGLDYRMMTEATVTELARLGLTELNISLGEIGSGARSRPNLSRFVHHAAALGLPCTVHFICGMRDDSPNSVTDALLFLHNLPCRIGISLFYPVPGLQGFDDQEEMRDHPPRRMCGSAAWPWTGSLSTAQMVTAFRLARWSNARKEREGGSRSQSQQDRQYNGMVAASLEKGSLVTLVRKGRALEERPVPCLDRPMMNAFFGGVSR